MGSICSFSGIYEEEPAFLPAGFTLLPLSDIRGTTGYCTPEAQEILRERIRPLPAEDIHLLDNGNYHYMTKLLIEKLTAPFDLVVLDHHTDMQPSALLPVLSCGNWILESLRDPSLYLRNVILIGPPRQAAEDAARQFADRVRCVPEEAANAGRDERRKTAQAVFRNDPAGADVPVYLSVDRDILAEEELRVNWDQGSMRLRTLTEWIGDLSAYRRICGADLCGEPAEATEDSRKCNELFIELLRNCKKLDFPPGIG